MEIKDRIIQYIKANGLSVRQFEIRANLSNGAVSKMGDSPRMSIIENILSAFPDIDRDWLISGETRTLKNGVPYYDVDFECGFDELINPGTVNPDCLIKMPGYEKATLWCNATGQSMSPEINNGDIIALRRIEDVSFLPYGEIYAIVTTNNMRTVKRLGRSDKPGHYRLIPTNKEYDEQDIPMDKILYVYRVMGAMKAF